MAIIHDLGETAIADIVVERGKSSNPQAKEHKEMLEKQVIQTMISGFAGDYPAVFHEMVENTSGEPQIFWQIDKLVMAIQTMEYEEETKKTFHSSSIMQQYTLPSHS